MERRRSLLPMRSAPQRVGQRRQSLASALAIAAAHSLAMAESPADTDTRVNYALEAGIQYASEHKLFWKLAETFAQHAAFNAKRGWGEFYVKPGVAATRSLRPGLEAYGALSVVASGTLGRDAFDAGNTGRVTLEDAYAGPRVAIPDTSARLDLSAGSQRYTLGTGMLVSNGASNGFDRGALKLGPRRAFAMTGIARLTQGPWSTEAFYLAPNEQPDNDSGTRLVGAVLQYKPTAEKFAGLSYGKVTRSSSPYTQAALGGIGHLRESARQPPAVRPVHPAHSGRRRAQLDHRCHLRPSGRRPLSEIHTGDQQTHLLHRGVSFSRPGEGMTRLMGGSAPVWRGWLVNLVVMY
ncbi:hypothetical protein [Polaromonas sp. SM01]|uniref:hypothetical protein n=1 Tax=Polaromonas sp. SM01 TaxID=3085630 RepID=UPI0029815DA2|nr:hypothetical protein [Polaromonas sp. SM01]MDW5443191.1 hypothetical protein [Polaromonas sp. SM01]